MRPVLNSCSIRLISSAYCPGAFVKASWVNAFKGLAWCLINSLITVLVIIKCC